MSQTQSSKPETPAPRLGVFLCECGTRIAPGVDHPVVELVENVLDGHHRVSVARELGAERIEGYVIPVATRVPLSPGDSPDDLTENWAPVGCEPAAEDVAAACADGLDNDGDGQVNEDGIGGYDGNRDWGFNWEPNYVQSGAHKYPFSQPENQAIRDFTMKHRNITGAQTFHNSGGMILRGPSIQGGGAESYSRTDDAVINEIGRKGEQMLPGYKLLTIWKDMYTVYGGELDWMHGAMGTFVFSNELWTPYLMFYDTASTDQYEFDKLLLFEDGFIPWQKINHPVYGEVELGGFSKMLGRLHPGFMIETDAHRNAAFCIYNAYQTPKLEVSDLKVKKLEGGFL